MAVSHPSEYLFPYIFRSIYDYLTVITVGKTLIQGAPTGLPMAQSILAEMLRTRAGQWQ